MFYFSCWNTFILHLLKALHKQSSSHVIEPIGRLELNCIAFWFCWDIDNKYLNDCKKIDLVWINLHVHCLAPHFWLPWKHPTGRVQAGQPVININWLCMLHDNFLTLNGDRAIVANCFFLSLSLDYTLSLSLNHHTNSLMLAQTALTKSAHKNTVTSLFGFHARNISNKAKISKISKDN